MKRRSLAAMVVREIQEGKSIDYIRAELERKMSEAPPVLDEPGSQGTRIAADGGGCQTLGIKGAGPARRVVRGKPQAPAEGA